jgi:hypothetical protein
MLSAIIDGTIIVLLMGSIAYGYSVSRKVRHLMATLKELEPLVEEFSSAVDKSETSVQEMRRNIEVAEAQDAVEAEPEAPVGRVFASRRAGPAEMPGHRVVRDKKDLVRQFFETSNMPARART